MYHTTHFYNTPVFTAEWTATHGCSPLTIFIILNIISIRQFPITTGEPLLFDWILFSCEWECVPIRSLPNIDGDDRQRTLFLSREILSIIP